MTPRQASLVAVLLAVAAAVVVAPAVGASGSATADVALQTGNGSDNTTEAAGANGTSLGAQLSGFMQASSAGADGSVDSSMWAAEFNGSDEPEKGELVTKRVARLEARLDRLEDRMTAVEAAHENGTLPEPAYVAQASSLTEQIDSLETAINQTDDAARQTGVNATRLDDLRRNASALQGREVARAARNLSVLSPPGLVDRPDRGPPVDIGPPEDAGPPDDAGPAENRTGRPDDAGPEDNRTGPPEDAGPDGERGNRPEDAGRNGDSGPPADAGEDSGADDPGRSGERGASDGADDDGSDGDGTDEGGGSDGDDADDNGGSGGGSGNAGSGGGNPGRGR